MEKLLAWLIKKAETTKVGKFMVVFGLVLLTGLLLFEILTEPKVLVLSGKGLLIGTGGLLIVAVFRLLYLFFSKRK